MPTIKPTKPMIQKYKTYGTYHSYSLPLPTTTPRVPSLLTNHFWVLVAFVTACVVYWSATRVVDAVLPFSVWGFLGGVKEAQSRKVDVELFVMAKCPDAVFCEGVFANVLLEVSSITHFTTHYIASRNTASSTGLTCKHGPSECQGTLQQLCMRHLHPDPKIWFNYILCTNRDYRAIPDRERAEGCARAVGVEFEELVGCVESMGKELAWKDVEVGRERGVS
ncbi:hypothetical protein SpCBS45565_g01152 [Spizellomyces sp. 'palustris']|nr:hypothetical protein SpCBS45565_g01152 [Spizellomyces sp. 'palustris']